MAMMSTKRLQKELAELNGVKGTPPAGINLLTADNLASWRLELQVLGESLYQVGAAPPCEAGQREQVAPAGETFAVEFRFGPRYPIESPAVVFVVNDKYKAPVHPHVYSNGLICASILGNEWSPVLSVSAVCLTLQSMLASCKEKKLPDGNDAFVKTAPTDPKKVRFVYDDDTV
ncbi:hypothetical protein FRC00_010723 [Tulasnella sp. 408]|nr:hypothetical protein FRC00_010723 [Tulasnella sp. 408]